MRKYCCVIVLLNHVELLMHQENHRVLTESNTHETQSKYFFVLF